MLEQVDLYGANLALVTKPPSIDLSHLILSDLAHVSDQDRSLEQALSPYLFPSNTGAWDGTLPICDYWHLRCTQRFTCFTFTKNYLLLKYPVRQAHLLSSHCPLSVLKRDMAAYTAHHPLEHSSKPCSMCSSILYLPLVWGSPAYFKQQLQNLLAMVAAWDLPHFFLTQTADEHSRLHWTEINDMEQLLKSLCSAFSLKMPR